MDAIIIEGLKVDTVVGCFNWERQIIQPLMLDITIGTSLEQASNSDELEDTLNYAEICEISAQPSTLLKISSAGTITSALSSLRLCFSILSSTESSFKSL